MCQTTGITLHFGDLTSFTSEAYVAQFESLRLGHLQGVDFFLDRRRRNLPVRLNGNQMPVDYLIPSR